MRAAAGQGPSHRRSRSPRKAKKKPHRPSPAPLPPADVPVVQSPAAAAPAPARAPVRAASPARPPASFEPLFDRGLLLFQDQEFEKAQAVLEQARSLKPRDPETLLLLGITHYRREHYGRAEELLKQAVERGDAEVQGSARVFLGLVYKAQGASDRARREIELAGAQDKSLGATLGSLSAGLRPHVLTGSLVLSPEYDGNVQLRDYGTWSGKPADNMDGDVLLLATLTVRPVPRLGLSLSNTLAYRQQFRFQDYNLVLNTSTLGYGYLGPRHRIRAGLSFSYAMLGGDTLYLDGAGRAAYRLRLVSRLGLLLTYDGRYRRYQPATYAPFTGQIHTLQAELGWGLSPEPVLVSVGYQAIREQLAPPVLGTTIDPTTMKLPLLQDGFSAWAHGPLLRLRALLSRRVELALTSSGLLRLFDAVPGLGTQRSDWYLFTDLSANVECTPWLDFFAGGTLIYNQSSDSFYTYLKPAFYLGVAGSFSAF